MNKDLKKVREQAMRLPAKSAPSKRNSKYTALKQKHSLRGTGDSKEATRLG